MSTSSSSVCTSSLPTMKSPPPRITVLDGGFSTQLARHVKEPIDGDPLWSARFLATNPTAVYQTHLDFLLAGAEVIITNSYQASIDGFGKYLGLDEVASLDLIKESVRLACKARTEFQRQCPADDRPLIAGSVGSYGASLHDGSEYTGSFMKNVSRQQLRDWHRPRVQTLLEAQVDLLAIETIPVSDEAEVLLDLLAEEFPQAKAWLSFQCKDGEHTAAGEEFGDVVRRCWSRNSKQLIAVGCNCLNPSFVTPLLINARNFTNTTVPFIVYPNSGEEYTPQTGSCLAGTPSESSVTYRWTGFENRADLAKAVGDWLSLGVKFVGGCCRTDASDVKIIRKSVNNWLLKNNCHSFR